MSPSSNRQVIFVLVFGFLSFVKPAKSCSNSIFNNETQFAVIPDFKAKNHRTFRSIHSYCPAEGWSDKNTRSYTDCYEKTLSDLPPFHVDISKLSDCRVSSGGTVCTSCNDCVKPLKLYVRSVAIENFVVDSVRDEVLLTVASELFWADPRLWGTAVTDINKVWRPQWHIAVLAVNETREELTSEVVDPLEETSDSNTKLVAPVFNAETDSFDTRTSRISCMEMDFSQSCNTQDLESCGVRERLTQTVVVKMAHALYDRYPFDYHFFRIVLTFPAPYSFMRVASWGIEQQFELDWGHSLEEFENPDGTKSFLPLSVIKSLHLLTVPEYEHETNVGQVSNQDFVIDFKLKRRPLGILMRFGLPIIFLSFVTTLVPTLGTNLFHPRNIVCIMGMLTAVTLNNAAHAASPSDGTQFTWLDSVFLVSMLFSFGALMENFAVFWLQIYGWSTASTVVDKCAMYTLPLFYASILIFVSALQLREDAGVQGAASIPLALTVIIAICVLVEQIHKHRKLSEIAAAAHDPEAAEPLTLSHLPSAAQPNPSYTFSTRNGNHFGGHNDTL